MAADGVDTTLWLPPFITSSINVATVLLSRREKLHSILVVLRWLLLRKLVCIRDAKAYEKIFARTVVSLCVKARAILLVSTTSPACENPGEGWVESKDAPYGVDIALDPDVPVLL